ncbi:MAG: tRNA pseudouridine(38-40) synthase TruA [Anaerolineae bacterium]
MPPNLPENHYKATIAYDGTDFLGFQIQARGRTVQGTLENALKQLTNTPTRVTGAGRTDAGVHATGQVIAFRTVWKHTAAELQRALNATLPADIVIKTLTPAPRAFHPRFDARSRQYCYTILNQPVRDVLRQRYTVHIARPLNVARMQQATLHLVGTRNFASFGRPPQGDNTVRTVSQAEWRVSGSEVIFTITANAFLYRMVRTIVGTLVEVGLGRIDVERIPDILQAQDRAQAGPPAKAGGLCLVNVTY